MLGEFSILQGRNTFVTASVSIIASVLFSSFFYNVEAMSESQMIYPPNSKPFGLSHGEWSAKWWQWALSIDNAKNPVNDQYGNFCASNQNDPNVWFLAGTGGGKVTRTCTIPADKSIFFPIVDVECSYAESNPQNPLHTEKDLRDCAKKDQDNVNYMKLIIDGINIENLTKYRTDSPIFNFTTPQDGLFGLHSAKSQGASDGYFVMVKPLSPGSHQIIYSATYGKPTSDSPLAAAEDTTNNLNIK